MNHFQQADQANLIPTVPVASVDSVNVETYLPHSAALALTNVPLDKIMAKAAAVRDQGYGRVISYSRKVFIPLTQLCRDVCHYCTFAKAPKRLQSAYLTPDQVLNIARQGQAAGCKESLFTLGDKPELRYRMAREALDELGYASTLEYLAAMAKLVHEETGLLPHLNPGLMSADDIQVLRQVSVSMGLMLESSAQRLSEKGGCHYGSPDKLPERRLATIAEAGRQHVPFTTGILIGIGETREERIESLLALRDLHHQYGHLQEIIIQNFRAKLGTQMANAPEPDRAELQWTIAAARLIFGAHMSIQAPPNLSTDGCRDLLAAGINDWGGISPVTPDHVNPEAPWPQLAKLAKDCVTNDKLLVERLGIYPRYLHQASIWLPDTLRQSVLNLVDADGLVREDDWLAGNAAQTIPPLKTSRGFRTDIQLGNILTQAMEGNDLGQKQVERLFAARDKEVLAVTEAANQVRKNLVGDSVSYVVTRNINYTNMCTYRCQFCAFAKGRNNRHLRGKAYNLDPQEVAQRALEAWQRGAVEVCLQGGIHPSYTGQTYINIVKEIKALIPDMHVHGFSPLEVFQGAQTLGITLDSFIGQLMDAGLGSMPGTAAEILNDQVRATLCPDKINTQQWLEVMRTAHSQGLKTTATIMFSHIEQPRHWAEHLLQLRQLQKHSGGFTELVPLPFVHMEAPIYHRGISRRGPTWRESILMHAVARLVLNPYIINIQASWVKLGSDGLKACLSAGVNDLGGTLMDESITRSAGAEHGQEMTPQAMEALAADCHRPVWQRTTLYAKAPSQRRAVSFN